MVISYNVCEGYFSWIRGKEQKTDNFFLKQNYQSIYFIAICTIFYLFFLFYCIGF